MSASTSTLRRVAATLTIAVGLVTSSVAAFGATSHVSSTRSMTATKPKAFCAAAKSLAALDSKSLKDITSNVDVLSPSYVSKQFGATLAAVHVLYLHSPAAILATSKQYVNACIEYGKQIGEVHWKLQPTDPDQQKIVLDATKAYGPVATTDLPKLDSFVKKTCGFGPNLITAAK